MPLVRIDIIKGKSTEYKKQVLECVHAGLEEALGIPDWDRSRHLKTGECQEFRKDETDCERKHC